MASKSRGGLSKREVERAKAAQAAAAAKKKSSSSSSSSKKSVAPLVGAGPLLPGQTRVGAVVTGAGPLLPGQTRAAGSTSTAKSSSSSSKSSSSNKSSSKPTVVSKALGIGKSLLGSTAEAASENTSSNSRPQTSRVKTGLGSALSGLEKVGAAGLSNLAGGAGFIGKGLQALGQGGKLPDLGVTESLGLNKFISNDVPVLYDTQGKDQARIAQESLRRQDEQRRVANNTPTGYGPRGETFYNNANVERETRYANQNRSLRDFLGGREEASDGGGTQFAPAMPQAPQQQNFSPMGMDPGVTTQDQRNQTNIQMLTNPENIQNPMGTNQGRFGGGYGLDGRNAGMAPGLTGNAMLDQYIASLQAQTKGDFGYDEVSDQYRDLIKSLNPQYEDYQKAGEAELNKAKQEDLNRLLSIYAGYGTADSEQRMQQQERVGAQYADSLAGLLAKLNTAKQGDINNFKTQRTNALQDILNTKRTTQMSVLDKIFNAQQSMAALARKGSGSSGDDYLGGVGTLQQLLAQQKGQDGFVSPQAYLEAQSDFLSDYPQSASKFGSLFPQQLYLSPGERKNFNSVDPLAALYASLNQQ